MKTRLTAGLLGLVVATTIACSGPKGATRPAGDDLSTLVEWMCGDFSSQAQSLRDTAFFDIRLHIRPILPSSVEQYVV